MIHHWGISDTGAVRAQNQDSFYHKLIREDLLLAIVCDGMGGAKAGNVASSLAVTTASEYLEGAAPDKLSAHAAGKLCEASRMSNRAVFHKACREQECRGMGTTMVCVLVHGSKASILNIGDSRAYHISGEGITKVTRDHSVVEDLLQQGRITPEEARNHPKKNLITRCLGTECEVDPDLYEVKLKVGDRLLLCTDGLSNVLTDQEMLYEVVHGGSGETCCQRMLDIALSRGAPDNVTAVLIEIA